MHTAQQQVTSDLIRKIACFAVLGIMYAAAARADVTGTYAGQFSVIKPPSTISASGTLNQTPPSHAVSGTVSVTVSDAVLTGTYTVKGNASATRFILMGKNGSARLIWGGKIGAGGLSGKAMIMAPGGHRLRGTLTFGTIPTGPGADLYTANCAPCHGAAGGGVTGLGPNVQCVTAISSFVRAGGLGTGRMPVYPTTTLSDADIALIQGFLAAVCSGAGASPGSYAGTCASCHGADALGVPGLGPDIHCNKAIQTYVRNGITGPLGTMPAFSTTVMPDATIATIQTFLNGLCPNPTPADVFASNCVACHGADGSGSSTLPSLQCSVGSLITHMVRSGRGVMPAFTTASLTNAQLTGLINYIGTLGCSGLPLDMYLSNCSFCHGATAGGGQGGPNIRCTSAQSIQSAVQGGEDSMPAYPDLSSTQITDMANYLNTNFCPLGGGGGG